jgi:predicted DNA-binding protein YlxM (UPF0122 family)
MIDYSQWPRKKFLVKSLKLDNENPRLSGFGSNKPTQNQVVEYMLEYEKVIQLAKDISKMGFLPNEEPIVFKENNKYIVVEGNRRVTACKVLVDPELIPKKSSKNAVVKRLLKEFNSDYVKSLSVIIAPSREAADTLIVNRHTDGSAIERWDKTKQDRFFYHKFNDGMSIDEIALKFNLPRGAIKDSLTRFNIFEELQQLDLTGDEKMALADETKFSITNIERVYKSKQGKSFLGVEVDSKGNLVHMLPRAEYKKRLGKLATDAVVGLLNSRTYGDEKLQTHYLSKFDSDPDLNLTINPSKIFESEYNDVPEQAVEQASIEEPVSPVTHWITPNTTAPSNKLIPAAAHHWRTGNVRIDRIFKELRDANLNDQFNATVILFRSYLDMIFYQYLNKHSEIHELIKVEQQKINEENAKKLERGKKYLIGLGVLEENIDETDLKKVLGIKTGVPSAWVPSLRQMLGHLTSSNTILSDVKLKQALIGYIKGHEDYLGHNDLNLLVHNEYYTKTKVELKKTWENLYPVLSFINENSQG